MMSDRCGCCKTVSEQRGTRSREGYFLFDVLVEVVSYRCCRLWVVGDLLTIVLDGSDGW